MIDSGLTRKVKTLHRDLGWALVMSREGVLSESAYQRLHERFQDASSALAGRADRRLTGDGGPGCDETAQDVSSTRDIAGWLHFLESVVSPHSTVAAPTLGPE